jgi:hypothetical protein
VTNYALASVGATEAEMKVSFDAEF